MKQRIGVSARIVTDRLGFLHIFSIAVCVAVMIFAMSAFVSAQNTVTGAFQGKVTSVTGGDIPGAAVTITNEKTLEVYTLITDSRGEFYQGLLAPGVYLIDVEIADFKPRRLRRPLNITRTGEVVPVPVSLEPIPPGTIAAPVAAAGESADDIRVEINTIDARRDGSFDDEKIAVIPLGSTTITRTLDELALLLPGVAPPPQTIGDVAGPGVGPGVGSAGQFAVNGLRSRANNFTVDGSDNNDEDIGVRRQGFVALSSQPVESVQEFQIITLLAPAQFGRNIGAQVNIVSKTGGSKTAGSVYGFFNSDKLNARNFFDTTNGNDSFALRSATGQSVLLDGQPLIVRNNSGDEDSFTAVQGGGTLGGAIVPERLFYFVSGEYQKINATQEKSFAVPTIEQRGPFRTGTTGLFSDFFTGANVSTVPNTAESAAVFSLFPFPNNLSGTYGENTFTQGLPADGRASILTGRIDQNFNLKGRQQTITGRYNFSDDNRTISAINEAVFSSVRSKIRTQNLSLFLNGLVSKPGAEKQTFNQIRFSIGRSQLNFEEERDSDYLIPSDDYPHIPFLLNAPLMYNATTPTSPGVANTGPVQLTSVISNSIVGRTVESVLRPVGQVLIRGFSPLGTDVYNFPQTRANNTYQLADEFSIRLNNHNLIFGADIRRTDLKSDLPRLSRPLVVFNGVPRLMPRSFGSTCANGEIRDDIGGFFCFPGPQTLNPVIRAEDLAGLNAASNFLLTFNVDRPDTRTDLRFYQNNFYGQDIWRVNADISVSFGLRYEYNSPVREANRLIEQTFNDPRLLPDPANPVPGIERFLDGRTTIYDGDANNFAPRFGIAYAPNLFGKNRTSVIRGGYGIFYDQILGAVVNQSRNVPPTFRTIDGGGALQVDFAPGDGGVFLGYNNPAGISPPRFSCDPQITGRVGCFPCPATGSCFTLFLGAFPPLIVLPGSLNILVSGYRNLRAVDTGEVTLPARRLQMPLAHHYSVVFEQQLNQYYSLSVAYAGTIGRKLLRFTTPNLGPSNTVAANGLFINAFTDPGYLVIGVDYRPERPVKGVRTINQFETTASSRYDSFQTLLKGRFRDKVNLDISYTLSKTSDDASDVFDLAGAYALPQNSFDLKAERGPANFDVRHRWAYQAIYNVPNFKANSFLRFVTKDLQIASTGKFHSGQPFTVNSTIDINLDGNLTDRLNTTQGIEITGDREQPIRLTTDNFLSLLAPIGQDGSVKRNSFRAGNVLELDLSVIKQFSINSRRLSFRTDIFNFINRANFGIPIRLLEAAGFGKATSTVTSPRRIQFSLKYEF